ncbi:hypothetical protein DB30_02656 [Enhygromyxa salina]|uniref:Uncharacterized protein n=1 Tax=Enhygromyxa salina TaxID=215803 RepID=A0A0C2DD68_9BACT|nr:hypothetical protein DB30_02656 [Enhygromyxa salina]
MGSTALDTAADSASNGNDSNDSEDGAEADSADPGPTLDLAGNEFVCDVWLQDCPANQKCSWEIVDAVAHPSCVPLAANPKPPGEACTTSGDPGSGHDDCELGAMCTWLDQQNAGVCLALCSGSPGAPSCDGAVPAICQPCSGCPSLCVPTCDPLANNCGPGYACAPNGGNFTCTPSTNLGAGVLGDPCEYAVQCAEGFACIEGAAVAGCEQAGCCSPFCKLSLPECPNFMTCEPWFEAGEPPPVPDVGVCKSA